MNRITRGSGNVFEDLGLGDAGLLQAKADVVYRISAIIEKRGLTQLEAAKALGVTQPKISALLHGRLEGFDPSHTDRTGAGNCGSANAPTAIPTIPGLRSDSQ
jgi:predicted XRE-type DNA-binding protein